MNKFIYVNISLQLSKSYKFLIYLYKSAFSNKKIKFNILKVLIENQSRGKNLFKYIRLKKFLRNIFFKKRDIIKKYYYYDNRIAGNYYILNKFYYICLRFESLMILEKYDKEETFKITNNNYQMNYVGYMILINQEIKDLFKKFKLNVYLTKGEIEEKKRKEEEEKRKKEEEKRKEEEEKLKKEKKLKEEEEKRLKELEKQKSKNQPYNRFAIPILKQKEKKKTDYLKVPTTEEEKKKLLDTPITNPLYLKIMEEIREEKLKKLRRLKIKNILKKLFSIRIKNKKIFKIYKKKIKKIKKKENRPFILSSKYINFTFFSLLISNKNYFISRRNFFRGYSRYYNNIMDQYRINRKISIYSPNIHRYNEDYNYVSELYNNYINDIKFSYSLIKRFRKKNIYINIVYFHIPKKIVMNYNPSQKNMKYLNIYWNKSSFYNKLIGFLIKHGKKIKAELIINNSFNLIKELIFCNPLLFLYKCIYNSIPLFIFDLRKKKNYSLSIPKIIPYEKRINIAIRKITKEVRDSTLSRNLRKINKYKVKSIDLLYNSLISHFFIKGKIKKELLLNIKNAFINKHLFKNNSEKVSKNYNFNKLFKYSSFKKIKKYKF